MIFQVHVINHIMNCIFTHSLEVWNLFETVPGKLLHAIIVFENPLLKNFLEARELSGYLSELGLG